MDDLTKHWSTLSLSDREGSGLRLKKEQAVGEFSIAARFFTKRTLNIEAIARTFSPLWRSKKGFNIKNIGDHIILFSFESEAEVDRILALEPWCFDKHLMALSKINLESSLEECNFNNVSFWVQVYDIPLRYRNKEVAEQICETLGVIQHPNDPPVCDGGSFIRVRVSINISFLFAVAVSSPWMMTRNIGSLSNTKDSLTSVIGAAGSRILIRTARSGSRAKAPFKPNTSSLGHG